MKRFIYAAQDVGAESQARQMFQEARQVIEQNMLRQVPGVTIRSDADVSRWTRDSSGKGYDLFFPLTIAAYDPEYESAGSCGSISIVLDTAASTIIEFSIQVSASLDYKHFPSTTDRVNVVSKRGNLGDSIQSLPWNFNAVVDALNDLYSQASQFINTRDNYSPQTFINDLLRSYNIESRKCNYRIVYHLNNQSKTVRFNAPGDWIACFGLLVRRSPTPAALYKRFGDSFEEDMEYYAEQFPTAQDLLADNGPAQEWAFPDEYSWVERFENLTTGEIFIDIDPATA